MISLTTLKLHKVRNAILAIFSLATVGNGAIILETNFDSIAAGPATEAALNLGITGGTWDINTFRHPSTATIQDSGGNHALLLDDDTAPNTGRRFFSSLLFASPADFSTPGSSLIFDFTTATRRTGGDKGLEFRFMSSGVEAARIDWLNDNNVFLNGSLIGTVDFAFLFPWNPLSAAVIDNSFTFSDGMVTAEFGGLTSTATLPGGVTSIDTFQIFSLGDIDTGARGVYLDNIQATILVPEPSSICLMASMVITLFGFCRKGLTKNARPKFAS